MEECSDKLISEVFSGEFSGNTTKLANHRQYEKLTQLQNPKKMRRAKYLLPFLGGLEMSVTKKKVYTPQHINSSIVVSISDLTLWNKIHLYDCGLSMNMTDSENKHVFPHSKSIHPADVLQDLSLSRNLEQEISAPKTQNLTIREDS